MNLKEPESMLHALPPPVTRPIYEPEHYEEVGLNIYFIKCVILAPLFELQFDRINQFSVAKQG